MFHLALDHKPIDVVIDYEYLSQKTEGYLASDISVIVYDAARQAFRKKSPISMSLLKNVLATRKPSLTKIAINDYEKLRQKFENQNKEKQRARIGFVK